MISAISPIQTIITHLHAHFKILLSLLFSLAQAKRKVAVDHKKLYNICISLLKIALQLCKLSRAWREDRLNPGGIRVRQREYAHQPVSAFRDIRYALFQLGFHQHNLLWRKAIALRQILLADDVLFYIEIQPYLFSYDSPTSSSSPFLPLYTFTLVAMVLVSRY